MAAGLGTPAALAADIHTLRSGETAWAVCNLHGIGMEELQRLNKGISLDQMVSGQTLRVPSLGVGYGGMEAETASGRAFGAAQNALIHAAAIGETPKDGLVAVKVGTGDNTECKCMDMHAVM